MKCTTTARVVNFSIIWQTKACSWTPAKYGRVNPVKFRVRVRVKSRFKVWLTQYIYTYIYIYLFIYICIC